MLIDVLSMISLIFVLSATDYLSIMFLLILIFFMWRIQAWEMLFARYRENLSEIELKFSPP